MSDSTDETLTPFDMLPSLIWASGPDGTYTYFNRSWLAFTGRTLEEEIGDGWKQGVHAEDLERRLEIYREAFEGRQPFQIDYRLRDWNGKYQWVTDSATPAFDANGQLSGFIGCCLPTRGPEAVEGKGEKKEKQGKGEGPRPVGEKGVQRAQALSVLAGGIAHEFNNLLTPILLNLSMAQSQVEQLDGSTVKDVQKQLLESEEAAVRAKELTNRLLAFGRGGNPERETMDVATVIREAVELGVRGTEVKGEITMEDGLWQASIDRNQISEVILNLVTNAVEAMGGSGTVKVRASNVEKVDREKLPRLQGPQIAIRIEDTGPGIRFDVVDRIFDPYFTTKEENGDGLGLSTAQAMVRNHSGDIVLESEAREGAVFEIYLPSAEEAGAKKHDWDKKMAGQGRVLIMDDEALVRNSVAAILQAYGYEVETACDGAEALEAYQTARQSEKPIDCALIDLTIHGGMGGKEAMGRLKQLDPEVKGVVCSGYSNDMIMDNFQNYGFKAAIRKPFEPDELNRVLQELIHS